MRFRKFLILTATTLTCLFIFSSQRLTMAESCKDWAEVVSVQGNVQVKKAGESKWLPAIIGFVCCSGDALRVQERSRADLLMFNGTLLRLDQNTSVSFTPSEKEKFSLLNLLKGAAHFFTRTPRTLKIVTPFVNATVEGTEFFVKVERERTLVSVFDGRVVASNQTGEIVLAKGQSAIGETNRPPRLYPLVRPRDAVQWALYYPPVLYYRPEAFEGPVRRSIEFYRVGDLQRAIESIAEIPEDTRDPRFFIYRASLLLSVGRVEEAELDIEKAMQSSPGNVEALALQSVIAVAQNEKAKALSLAKKATEAGPDSAAARIALSYGLQANFNLQEALTSLKDAVKLEPENALAWARLAELYLSFGRLSEALKAADRAVTLNPNLSRTQTVLGFVYLIQIKTKDSIRKFQKAIDLDQGDPLPRLGLGLAKIREGDLEAGRKEIEIAASLDPDNSLIRSYLGKAYYEEKRDRPASNQFTMAKELDPSDPTPFFYDAIRKQSVNRPVEALYDLQESIELNDNRAVYRSRLLLDSDLAARSASLGRIYSDLGFQQIALVEGWKSVNMDPANFSAHRFLADSYSVLPRHEIARVSELLQSQLLQPININPVQPQLAESNLSILSGAGSGPANPSFNEFNPLFDRNRLAFQASGISGNQDTWGDEAVQSGVWNWLSYSVGQFHFETDGFRRNNDLSKDVYNVFAQASLSPKTSIQAEFRSVDTEKGDLELRFFPNDFLPNRRIKEESKSVRAGFHHAFSPGADLIGSFAFQDEQNKLQSPSLPIKRFDIKQDRDSYGGELQYLMRLDRLNFVAGAGRFDVNGQDFIDVEVLMDPALPLVRSRNVTEDDIHHTNLYLYSQINYPKNVTLTIGGSADFFKGGDVDRNRVNPKLGLTWTPFSDTTLRGAIFRVLNRTLIPNQNQTLEPTQVAGFNQFFDDVAGTESWRWGLAVDQKFSKISKTLYAGFEYSRRYLKVPFTDIQPPAPPEVIQVHWKERLARAYLYWTPHPWFAFSGEYQYERFDREKEFTAGIEEVKTQRFPIGVRFYHPSGFGAGLKASYIDQEGKFVPQLSPPHAPGIPGHDQFWLIDTFISYRLPKRFGLITVGVKNLFDKSFKFQDTDPVSPTIQPARFIFGKVTLAF